MAKKIIIPLVILVAIAAGLFYVLRDLEPESTPASSALSAIPTSAALVYETKDIHQFWSKISQSNVMWQGLQQSTLFAELNAQGTQLDSLVQKTPVLEQLFGNKSTVVSAHMEGAGKFNFLLATAVPQSLQQADFEAAVRANMPEGATVNSRTYDDNVLFDIKTSNAGKSFTFVFIDGLLLISPSGVLVEEGVRHINSGASILENDSFSEVQKTAGSSDIDGNLYINYAEFPKIVGTYLNVSTVKEVLPMIDFAEWTELDLTVNTSALSLEGFTYSGDSSGSYLSVFRNQDPQDLIFHEIAPMNTAVLLEIGVEDFAAFQKDHIRQLEQKKQLSRYTKTLGQAEADCGCGLTKGLSSWIGTNMGLIITEPLNDAVNEQAYAVFLADDPIEAHSALQQLGAQVELEKGVAPSTETYKNYVFTQLDIGSALDRVFGNLFNPIETPWYTIIDDYVLYANSPAALRSFIVMMEKENTLDNDPNYNNFAKNLSSESNIYLYNSIARSPNLYKSYLSEEYASLIDSNMIVYRQFEGISFQLSKHKNGLYLNQVNLKYNPVYKQVTTSLWETALDTSLLAGPWLAQNHYTETQEVLAQDAMHELYQISTTGGLLWKRALDGPIVGDIQQIDVLKNNKLQLLFVTSNKMYLIDRNGNDVGNFPIVLQAPAAAGLIAVDYDNQREYRILVPCANNQIYNYDKTGALVEGWQFAGSTSPIVQPLEHFVMGSKDYLFTVERTGKIHLLDRRGNERVNAPVNLRGIEDNALFADKQKTIGTTRVVYIDSTGTLIRVNFDGDKDMSDWQVPVNSPYAVFDLNGDRQVEYLIGNDDKVQVYGADKSLLFELEVNSPVTAIHVYPFESSTIIGVSTAGSNEVWAFDEIGKVLEGMPLYGSGKVIVNDINNDGNLNLITTDKNGKIFTYSIR